MLRLAPALVALSLFGGPARADVMAADPGSVLRAVQDFGFVATMDTDDEGDPKIVSRVSRSQFTIFFYGCTDNVDCGSIQFYTAYDIEGTMSALKVNEWNRQRLFTKATIDDEGDPALEMDVNLDYDGVGAESFADSLDVWRQSVESFEGFIDW